MMFFYSILIVLFINSLKSKQLTSDNCDKVSEELSAQGVAFEDKFQLNSLNVNDLLCIYNNVDGTVSSCCNDATEKLLAESATAEYDQIFNNEMKTVSESINNIHLLFLNISVQIINQFAVQLEFMSTRFSQKTTKIRREIVGRIVTRLKIFLRTDTPESTLYNAMKSDIHQYFRTISFSVCDRIPTRNPQFSVIRSVRHRRHRKKIDEEFIRKISNITKQSDNGSDINKALQTLISGLNATRLIIKVFSVSLRILRNISKCRECTLPEECSVNVMRMNHCSYCAGEALSRPCFPVCLQVISGCLWRLQTLSKEWKVLYGFIDKYFSKKRNQEHLLQGFADVYASIRELFTRIFSENTKSECFLEKVVPSFEVNLLRRNNRNLATHFSYEARQVRIFWENLAVTMCTRSIWFSSLSHNLHCWNGSTMTSPHWHKCSFCQQKASKPSQVPLIVTQSWKDILDLSSELVRTISSVAKPIPPKHRRQELNSDDDNVIKHSELSSKSKLESEAKNRTKENKEVWKELNKNNFLIFDDIDSSNDVNEGSSGRMVQNLERKKSSMQTLPINAQDPSKSGTNARQNNLFIIMKAFLDYVLVQQIRSTWIC